MDLNSIVGKFLIFGPLFSLVGLALFIMAASMRAAQIERLFDWLEAEGKDRGEHDYARDCYARAKLCRSSIAGFALAAVTSALSLVTGAITNQVRAVDHSLTLVIFIVSVGFSAFGLVMMVLDARVELQIFRARYEHLTGRDASQDSMWG